MTNSVKRFIIVTDIVIFITVTYLLFALDFDNLMLDIRNEVICITFLVLFHQLKKRVIQNSGVKPFDHFSYSANFEKDSRAGWWVMFWIVLIFAPFFLLVEIHKGLITLPVWAPMETPGYILIGIVFGFLLGLLELRILGTINNTPKAAPT